MRDRRFVEILTGVLLIGLLMLPVVFAPIGWKIVSLAAEIATTAVLCIRWAPKA
jgi:hypothetical protein